MRKFLLLLNLLFVCSFVNGQIYTTCLAADGNPVTGMVPFTITESITPADGDEGDYDPPSILGNPSTAFVNINFPTAGSYTLTFTSVPPLLTDNISIGWSADCSFDGTEEVFYGMLTAGVTSICINVPSGDNIFAFAIDDTDIGGEINMNIAAAAAVPNENCAGATVTSNGALEDNICSVDGLVWYSYTYIGGVNEDLDLSVTAGTLTSADITQVWVNGCPGIGTDVTTELPTLQCLQAGDIITFEVGDNTPAYGDYSINLTEQNNGVNFEICSQSSNLTPLTCLNTLTGVGNINACPDNESTCVGFDMSPGVWYSFTVTPAVKEFSITGSDFEVFTGANCASLVSFGCEGDANLTEITDNTSTYWVLVYDAGNFSVQSDNGAPLNDTCGNAVDLVDGNPEDGTLVCSQSGLTGSTCTNTSNAVYYQYTTPDDDLTHNLNIAIAANTATTGVTATGASIVVTQADCTTLYNDPNNQNCNILGSDFDLTCVNPNTTLTFIVTSNTAEAGDFVITVNDSNNGVANDMCLNPTTITLDGDCDWTDVSGDNTNACVESSAELCSFNTNATVWYSVTMPPNGIGFEFQNLTGGISIGVFNDEACTLPNGYLGTQLGACISANGTVGALLAGQTYHIAVASAGSPFSFEILAIVPPNNSACAMAEALTNGVSSDGTTACATPDDVVFCSLNTTTSHVVYYTYEVNPGNTTNTDVTIVINQNTNTTGSQTTDIQVELFTNCTTNALLTYSEESGDLCAGLASDIVLECVAPGTNITFAVGSPEGSEGDFDITVSEDNTGIPSNDLCLSPDNGSAVLGSCSWTLGVAGDNTNACPESMQGNGGCSFDTDATVWFSFDLPADAIGLEFDNITAGYSVGVFTSTCTAPNYFGTQQGNCVSLSGIVNGLSANTTYYVAVSGPEGPFNFDILAIVPPSNDDCADVSTFALTDDVATEGTTACATDDSNFGCASNPTDHVVYYEYTTGALNSTVTISSVSSTATTGTSATNIGLSVWEDCNGTPYNGGVDNEKCDIFDGEDLVLECVPANTTLILTLGSVEGNEGDFSITVDEDNSNAVANDNCDAPELITVDPDAICVWLGGNQALTQNACPETFDFASNCGFDDFPVVWYEFTAPAGASEVQIDITNAPSGTPFYAVFDGTTDCDNPVPVSDCESGTGMNGTPITIVGGQTYLIAFGSDDPAGSTINFNIKILIPPPGDDPCNPIVGVSGSNPGTTSCADHDYDFATCDADNNDSQVWVEYTLGAGETGVELTLTSTSGGPYTIWVSDFANGCSAPNNSLIDADAFNCNLGTTPLLISCLDPGTTIYIQVGTQPANEGDFDLMINPIVPDPLCVDNDECADADTALDAIGGGMIVTDADAVCVTDCNENACAEVIGNCLGGAEVNNVVWYQVTNDGLGEFIAVEITGADFFTPVIAIFDACVGAQIGPCTVGEDNGADTGPIEINPGIDPVVESYWIAIGSQEVLGGDFTICVQITSGCVNDDPCDAFAITDENVTIDSPASTVSCTILAGEPDDACNPITENTVWYKIEIPTGSNGFSVTINNVSISGDISVQIGEYDTNNCNTIGVPVATQCSGAASFDIPLECAFEGQEYYIQVSSTDAAAGDFTISVDFTTPAETSSPANDACGSAELFDIIFCEWVELTGTTLKACPEQFVDGACDYSVVPTVWYEVVIPDDPNIVEISVEVEGIDFNNPMFTLLNDVCEDPWGIYSANGGCNSGGNPVQLLDEDVVPGTTIKIAVASMSGEEGEFTIKIKVDKAPDNDDCETAEEIAPGGSAAGTTRCATKSAFDFSTCGGDLNNSDVYFEIPIDNSIDGLNITIGGFTAGAFGAQAFYNTGGCALMVATDPGGDTYEGCGTADKEWTIATKCLDPSITSIIIKVGSNSDDGNPGNGEEEGDFTITTEILTPSCDYADNCDEVGGAQQLAPITNPEFELDFVCLQSCLDFACPSDPVIGSPCNTDAWPTVWFQIMTDDIAAIIFATVETNGSWDATWTLYSGTSCDDLMQVSTAATLPCSNDDTTPEVLQQPVDEAFDTYWIAVTVDPASLPNDLSIDDPGFQLCVATTINAIVCLGDLDSGDCAEPSLDFEVTSVTDVNGEPSEIDPDGDLIAGPFCQGAEVCMTVSFFYDASETGVDWIIGFVPTFGDGWDMETFDFDDNAPTGNGSTAQWYEEGGDCNWLVQEPVPILCTYTDANGNLVLCNLLCETCPCAANTLQPGDQLPSGYAWVTNGGNAGCENDCSPGEGWGIGTTTVNITWEMCLTVKEFENSEDCFDNNNLQITFQTFSDGVGGCWEDPVGECLLDKKQVSPPWMIDCNTPPYVIATPDPEEICNDGITDIYLETDPNSFYTIEVWYDDNFNVIGENNHTFTNGSGTLMDQLENIGSSIETVTYFAQVDGEGEFNCPGPITEFQVIIYPELIVDFPPTYICLNDCTDLVPTISGGFPTSLYGYQWSTGESTSTINVCPTVPTTYFVTVTDDLGCTGIGEVEVDVKPNVEFTFEPDPVLVCKNGLFDPNDPDYIVTAVITSGTAPFQVIWDAPFGLFGQNSFEEFYIDQENSVPTFGAPYQLCATVIDAFGCQEQHCVEVTVFEAPIAILENTPVSCGDTEVDFNGSMVSINGSALDYMILYDCDDNIVDEGYSNPNFFAGIDLAEYSCFYLEVFDINGCTGVTNIININPPTGIAAIVDGTDARCINGGNANISVTNAADYVGFNWNPGGLNTPSILVSPNMTTTYTVTVTEANGCTDTETFTVTVNPIPVFSISGSLSFCTNSSTTLSSDTGMGWTYEWVHSVDGVISSTSSANITTPGIVTLTVTTAEGCSDTQSVNVIEDNNLNITLNTLTLCDNSPDTLRAGQGFLTYEWEGPAGPITGNVPAIEVNQSGIYMVTVTDVTGCTGIGVRDVMNNTSPMATVTDTIEICRVDNGVDPGILINFNDQVSGDAGTWFDTDGSGVSLTDLANVSFEGIPRDTYSFTYITNTALPPCMDVSVVMEVIVKACPCPNVSVISIPDQCNDDATPINLNNFLNANNMNPGSWSEVAGNPQTGLITNNMFTTLGTTAGTYQVQWTIATPVGACPTADTTSIVVFDAPNAAVSMNNLNLCNQDNNLGDFSVDLNTLLVNSDPGTWMQISGPTPLTGSLPTVNTEGLPVSSVLVYRYTTNNAMTPCTDDFVEVTINVIDCNCPFIVLGTDTLCNGDMTAFDLNSLITMNVTGQTGTWTTNAGAGVITGGNLFNPFGIASGQYTLTFTFDVDPGGSCQRIWNSTILIRRQPKATPKPSGMACNSSLSGGGPTVVLLNSLLETGYTAPGTWTQVDNGLPMLTIDATTSVDFDGSTIGDIFLFEYSVGANAPCTPITVTVSVVIIDCNCFEIGVLPPAPMCNSGGILDLTTLDDGSDSGDWSVTNDVGLPVTITNNILDVNGLDEGDYTITFTLNPAPPAACQKDSYVVLSISNQNFAIVTSTVSTCNNILDGNDNVVNFNDLVTMGGALNGTWENTDGAPVDLANPGLVVFDDPSIQIGDTYTFTFILPSDAPCVEQQYPVVVTIDCSNCDPVNPLTPQEHCTTESPLDLSIYDDPMRPGGDWTSTDITINNNLADLSGVANGVYVITYNVPDPQAPPCENSKDVMISIFNPVTTGTGEELRVCPGDTLVNLFDLLSGHDTGGVWVETSTSPSTGGAFNAGAGTFRTLNQVTGTFSFRYEFTNQDPCPDVSTSVTVVVENVPTADAGDEQFITCAVNQVTLNGSSSTGSNLVFMWTHQSGNPVNNANSPQITVNYGGTFTLTVTNSLTGCFSTDQVIVTVDPSIPQGVIASSDITCFGDNNGTITITNVSGGDGNFMYSIDGGVTFSSNTTFSDLGPGTYNVVVQDGQGCKIEQTEVIVQPVEVTVEAGPNQIIELGSNATISLGNQLDNLDVSVVWTAEDENGIRTICSTPDDCSEFSVTPAFDTQYCVTLTDANGCEDSDCLNIELRRVIDIVFPNIISPNNNDNTNETFYIESPSITFFKYLKIFDRWGSLVYSIEDVPSIPQSDGWNGTFNGKNVEQGVYAFIVSYIYTDANGNDAEETVAGDVTVVR